VAPTLVPLALTAMLAWGLWAAFAEVATRSIGPEAAMIVSYLTGVGVAVACVLGGNRSVELTAEGAGVAAVAGVFAVVGTGVATAHDPACHQVNRRGRRGLMIPEKISGCAP